MTLAQLIAGARIRLRDTVEPYLFDDPFITSALNEAEREACIRAKLLADESTAEVCEIDVTEADGAVYALHASVIEVRTAYLTDAYGINYPLRVIDREQRDREYPEWFDADTGRPVILMPDEKQVTLFPALNDDFTLSMSVYRLPLADMADDADEPEIHAIHQDGLYDWVEHRAYAIPDTDTYDRDRSESALIAFIRRFGQRPDANVHRKQRQHKTRTITPVAF